MSSLMIALQRKAFFTGIDEARTSLVALARELGAASVIGRVWTRFHGILLALDEKTIDLLLVEGRSHRADQPGQPTYLVPFNATPAGTAEVGLITLTLSSPAAAVSKPSTAAGVHLTARLPEASFTSDADALVRLLDRCTDALVADAGMIGPHQWMKDRIAGWATFTRRAGRDWLPASVRRIPTRTGAILVAHSEAPASESPAAREAVSRVRDSLNGVAISPPTPAAWTAPVPMPTYAIVSSHLMAAPVPPAPVAIPQFVAPPPPALRPVSNLAGTISVSSLPVPGKPPADPLPFGGAPSAEFVASLAAPASTTPHPEVGETLPLGGNLLAFMRPALPFDQGGSAPAPGAPGATQWPALTLDAYASLCAELAVFPLKFVDILRKYGVTDDAMKRGLDQHWRDLFTTAPPLHEEWQRKTAGFCEWLRRAGESPR